MLPKRYPLDPLVGLRRDKVEASTRDLAAAIRAREAATSARLAAEAEQARLAAEARKLRAAEEAALAGGRLSAADLQRGAAWGTRTAWDDQAGAEQVATAAAREAAAVDGERRERSKVAATEAEAKVTDEHRDRWHADAERATQATAEEGALEAWRPRR